MLPGPFFTRKRADEKMPSVKSTCDLDTAFGADLYCCIVLLCLHTAAISLVMDRLRQHSQNLKYCCLKPDRQ
jgi:hypothetical protein